MHGRASGHYIEGAFEMPDIEFQTGAGSKPGYLAVPDGERGEATIVLQEWWGVDEHIRSICDRFASEGFFALAPDLYGGETAEQPDAAQQLMMAMSMDEVEHEMCGAAKHLRSLEGFEGEGVGSVGFCLGGGLSIWAGAACPEVTATASFYYVLPHGKPDFSRIDGPVLAHFAAEDQFISLDESKALEQEMRGAGVDIRSHTYDGVGHAFFNDTNRLGTYDREAADLAWQRTVEFLRAALA
jgi:carboxymethylenebutenolidase